MLIRKWRFIKGFEDRYKISPSGRIFSTIRNKFLKSKPDNDGYLHATLSINGKMKSNTIHAFVAETFIGRRPEGKEVNHKDGKKRRNYYKNLEYIYPKKTRNTRTGSDFLPEAPNVLAPNLLRVKLSK